MSVETWSRKFIGRPECLADVRRFILAVLGDCDTTHIVTLVADELAGNAIKHTASGGPGGKFVLRLARFSDRCRVWVDDQGGPSTPSVRTAQDDEEAGRGLTIVTMLSACWGAAGDKRGRSVWAEITFDGVGAIPGLPSPTAGLPHELSAIRKVGMTTDGWTR
ncbi:serine/threonine-protein kinase RsbW [Catenulispora sp. MAP5-51]